MIKSKDKTALILSILYIIFNLLYWLFLLVGILLNLPDNIACIASIITYAFTFAGALTAILAKKNNIAEKMSVINLSAIGLILSVINILALTLNLFASIVLGIFKIVVGRTIIGIVLSISIIIDIIIIVKYRRTRPK